VNAQQWDWALQENVKKLAVDSAGNVFTHNDSIIKKFDSNGNFQWQKKISGDLLVRGMVADHAGNLYIAGSFTDFVIDKNHFISLGNQDIFFSKIDFSGALVWHKTFGSASHDNATSLSFTKKQKILICGIVGTGTSIGSTLFSEAAFFTAGYDLTGNLELLIHHSGGSAWEVSTDPSGNIYQLGGINTNDTLDFGNGVTLYGYSISDPFGSHFIAKFNSAGTILWANDLGTNYYKPFNNLATDNNGNFYLTKWERYSGFDINKFDYAGNSLWNRDINGTYGDCYSLSIDNNDSIWLTGYIWKSPFKGLPFIWEFDPSSNLKNTIPSTLSASGNNISNDYNNNIYVSGTFNDTAVFGTTTLIASQGDYFLAKMNRNSGPTTSLNNALENDDAISIYPSPSSGIFTISFNKTIVEAKISVYDVQGNYVLHNMLIKNSNEKIDLTSQPKGIYFVKIIFGNEKATKKIIIK
jgi:hypothetical protein